MKFIEAFKKSQEINSQVEEYPWHVWTVFFDKKCKPEIMGEQISMGYNTDYKTLDEVRTALEYMVDQMGGKVKWK